MSGNVPLAVGVLPAIRVPSAADTASGALRLDLTYPLQDDARCLAEIEILPPGAFVWQTHARLGPFESRTMGGVLTKPGATPTWGVTLPFARLAGTRVRLRMVAVVGAWTGRLTVVT